MFVPLKSYGVRMHFFCLLSFLFTSQVAWDQAPHWGKEKKKIGKQGEWGGSMGRGGGRGREGKGHQAVLLIVTDQFCWIRLYTLTWQGGDKRKRRRQEG